MIFKEILLLFVYLFFKGGEGRCEWANLPLGQRGNTQLSTKAGCQHDGPTRSGCASAFVQRALSSLRIPVQYRGSHFGDRDRTSKLGNRTLVYADFSVNICVKSDKSLLC